MTKLIGLSGSLRKASYNTALLRAAAEVAPAGTILTIESIAEIPLYDGDAEAAHGLPPRVQALKDAVAAADGLLIATPEYNNAIPGVLKNALDWMSRPANDAARVFGGKPVAVIGATPGGWGTLLSQAAWLPILRHLGAQHWSGGRLAVSKAGAVFASGGALTDPQVRAQLAAFVDGFAAYARSAKAGG